MLEVDIPGRGKLRLAYVVLDVNGTLALDGQLLPGVDERLRALRPSLEIRLVTGNTHARQDEIDQELGLRAVRLADRAGQGQEKAEYVRRLGASEVVAIGNGANDALALEAAALGIAVVGPEGAAGTALRAADVVTTDIRTALELLSHPRRLVATLRV
jgi:P-type E1-E2 ATPase